VPNAADNLSVGITAMPSHFLRPVALAASVGCLLVASGVAGAADPAAQRSFDTPEAAVRALLEAVGADSLAGVESILGEGVLDRLPPAEREARDRRRATARRLAAERILVRFDDAEKSRATILIGPNNVQFPVPLMRSGDNWTFDTETGIAEVARRQVIENEARAIEGCRAFGEAQAKYVSEDWDGDNVFEYAQRIRSRDGHQDGLYWHDPIAGPPRTLLNEAFAAAEGDRPGDAGFAPSGGYAFKVLAVQGEHAPGGAESYVVGSDMVLGYGVLAYPVAYGDTGVFTFMMNHAGAVYEKDLGPDSAEEAQGITAFDPDPSWRVVEPSWQVVGSSWRVVE
jgi:Protein of unknown function (DUF2950)